MKKWLVVMLLFVFATPVFASGNLTVNFTSLAGSYVNTNTSMEMLRLSLNVNPFAGDGTVNITTINVTLAGSLVYGNITGNISVVEIRNSTATLGINSTWDGNNKTSIRFSNGLFVNSSTNATVTIFFNITTNAARLTTVIANVNNSYDVGTAGPDNITIGTSNTSSSTQIQDVHATASISPKFVDTSVTNQSFGYTMTPTGSDQFQIINITIPSGYTVTNVVEVRYGASVLYNSTYAPAAVSFGDKIVNVNYSIGFTTAGGIISINFTTDTNSSQVTSSMFLSAMTGSNITYANTTTESINSTNVTTKQLFSVQSIYAIKTAAVVNGTDYWEFNITLNFTANVTTGGLVQFRMTNWNNTAGNIMNMTNQTALSNTTFYYASLRLSNNASNTFNITNNYNFTQGISMVPVENTLYYFVLKMIIPSATPVSSTWWSTYYTLFRSVP